MKKKNWPIPESFQYHFYFWSKCFTWCCWLVAVWFHQWKADCWQSQRQQIRFAHNPTFLFFLKSIFFLQKCIFLEVCTFQRGIYFSQIDWWQQTIYFLFFSFQLPNYLIVMFSKKYNSTFSFHQIILNFTFL